MSYIKLETGNQTVKIWPSEKVEIARKEIAERDGIQPHHLDFIGGIEYKELNAEMFSFNVNALGKYYRSTRSWTFYKD